MNKTDEAKLFESLSNSWNLVRQLSKLEAQDLFDAFVEDCINSDMASKFYKDFNSRKRIGLRFFKHCEELNDPASLYAKLKVRSDSELVVSALWNSYNDPVAFELQGNVTNASQVFVEGRDAVAKLSCEGKHAYLFMDGHMEEIAFIGESTWRQRR